MRKASNFWGIFLTWAIVLIVALWPRSVDAQFTVIDNLDSLRVQGVDVWDTQITLADGVPLVSNMAIGTAPFTITSTTLVSNLNVQYLNGIEEAEFGRLAQSETVAGTWTFGTVNVTTVDLGTNTITDGNLTGAWTGVTNLTMSGTLDLGTNTISDGNLTGAWTGVTNLTMSGTLDLGTNTISDGNLTGAWTGVTNLTATGTVQAEHLYSTDDAVIDSILTVGTQASSPSFQSSVFGSGWQLIETDGEWGLELDRLTVRGTLEAFVFKKNIVQASNALLLVTDSAKLDTTITAGTTTFAVVENTFQANDLILAQDDIGGNIYREVMTVTSVSSDEVVTTRATVGTARAWPGGTALVRVGNTSTVKRQGAILLDAGTTHSPFIDVLSFASAGNIESNIDSSVSNNTSNVKLRLGQLRGIIDSDVGLNHTDTYGLYANDVYLKGSIVANTGYIGGTNGWVIQTGKITSTGIGVATSTGDATYAFWAGHDTPASAEFSVTHAGAILATSGTIGGWTLAATTLTGGNSTLSNTGYAAFGTGDDYARIDAANATYRLWVGDATAGDAEFRVTKEGAVTATSATITGTITATAGVIGGFTVNATDGLYAGTGNTRVQMKPGAGFWAGETAQGSAEFSVTAAGALTSTSGTIGGWTIGVTTLESTAGEITLDASNKTIEIEKSGQGWSSTLNYLGLRSNNSGVNPALLILGVYSDQGAGQTAALYFYSDGDSAVVRGAGDIFWIGYDDVVDVPMDLYVVGQSVFYDDVQMDTNLNIDGDITITGSLTAGSTSVLGTIANTWTIDTDNSSTDIWLQYKRDGSNWAKLKWDEAAGRFELFSTGSSGADGTAATLYLGAITATGTVQAEHLYSTDDLVVDGQLDVDGDVYLSASLYIDTATRTIRFTGTAGGNGEGITYKDSGSENRYALFFPGSDVVSLANRAANGVVQVRANTLTAGSGGEVTVAQFEDNEINFYQTLLATSVTASSTVQAEHLYTTDDLVIGGSQNAGTDTDKFLVLDGSDIVDYRTGTELRSDIVASPLAGSGSIVTVGTIASGIWQGTAVADGYISSSGDWNAAYTHIGESGASHTYINQSITTGASPTFAALTLTGLGADAAGGSYLVIESNVVKSRTAANVRTDIGAGTVTSVAAGNGMDFTTITTTGSVTMGTPSTLTNSTTNAITTTSHTHAITNGVVSGTQGVSVTGSRYVIGGALAIGLGAITPTSVGGITSANLVDKSATETISGVWTFTGSVTIPQTADDATYTGIVTNDSGVLKYRTKAQVLSDIGAEPTFNKYNVTAGSGISLGGTPTSSVLAAFSVGLGALTADWGAGGYNIEFTDNIDVGVQNASGTHWLRPQDAGGNMHLRITSGGLYLDSPTVFIREYVDPTDQVSFDQGRILAQSDQGGSMLTLDDIGASSVDNANPYILFKGYSTNLGWVGYGSAGSSEFGVVNYQNDRLVFGLNSLEKWAIATTGDWLCAGAYDVGSSGQAIGTLYAGTIDLGANPFTNATVVQWNSAYTHIGESGASHTYINQSVTTGASPTFVEVKTPILDSGSATDLVLQRNNSTRLTLGDALTTTVTDIQPNAGYEDDIGALTVKYGQIHAGELWVETLVAHNTMATIAGRFLVGVTTTLEEDVDATETSIDVKHNESAANDVWILEADGQFEFMLVTGGPTGVGPYTYTVTRHHDGGSGDTWSKGDAAFNSGTTGEGFMDLYSYNGIVAGTTNGPTIVGNVRNSTTYNDYDEHWAIGNLKGLYGETGNVYGVGLGDVNTEHIVINETDIKWYSDASTVVGSLSGTLWVLGQTGAGSERMEISPSGIGIYANNVNRMNLTSAGVIEFYDATPAKYMEIGVISEVWATYGMFGYTGSAIWMQRGAASDIGGYQVYLQDTGVTPSSSTYDRTGIIIDYDASESPNVNTGIMIRIGDDVAKATDNYGIWQDAGVQGNTSGNVYGIKLVGAANSGAGLAYTAWFGGGANTDYALYVDGVSQFTDDMDITGALTATSYGGILEAALVDKSAAETISGNWTFSNGSQAIGGVLATNLVDKSATENISGNWEWQDNNLAAFGAGQDMTISHNGTNSYITNSTGILYISDSSTGGVYVRVNATENAVVSVPNGAVTLYYDNAAKLATASGGVAITGALTGATTGAFSSTVTWSGGGSANANTAYTHIGQSGASHTYINQNVTTTGTPTFSTVTVPQILGLASDPATPSVGYVNIGEYSDALSIESAYGRTAIGMMNTSYTHFYTESTGGFYFADEVNVLGNLRPFTDDAYVLGDATHEWSVVYAQDIIASDDIFQGDGDIHYFGDGNDMRIHHAGAYSYIESDENLMFYGDTIHLNYDGRGGATFFQSADAGENRYVYVFGWDAGSSSTKYGYIRVNTAGSFVVGCQAGESIYVSSGGHVLLETNTTGTGSIYNRYSNTVRWEDSGAANALRMSLASATGDLWLDGDLHLDEASGAYQVMYISTGDQVSYLPIGDEGDLLTVVSGRPEWAGPEDLAVIQELRSRVQMLEEEIISLRNIVQGEGG